MTLSVDLFWSFRSPYSYLALPKTCRLTREYCVQIDARPVYPLAVRDPDFFARTNPKFARYVVLDSRRVAEREGIAFGFPRPDPIVQNMQSLEIATDQPLIRRLMRLAAAAQLRGLSLPFICETSRLIWDGTTDRWDLGDHLKSAGARAGLDIDALEAQAASDPASLDAVIEANERDHAKSGHWGVPTFVLNGEPFFGQDRIDVLIWRLKQLGMKLRNSDS